VKQLICVVPCFSFYLDGKKRKIWTEDKPER